MGVSVSEYRPVNWEVFVVRLTRESGSAHWRGQIIHLPDQRSQHFTNFDQAMTFIDQFVSDTRRNDDEPIE